MQSEPKSRQKSASTFPSISQINFANSRRSQTYPPFAQSQTPYSIFPTGISISDTDSGIFYHQQQQMLLPQQAQARSDSASPHYQQPQQQQQQFIINASPDQTHDALISAHHMCQSFKDSLNILHANIDEIWTEVCVLKQKQDIIEEISGVANGVFEEEAEVPDDKQTAAG